MAKRKIKKEELLEQEAPVVASEEAVEVAAKEAAEKAEKEAKLAEEQAEAELAAKEAEEKAKAEKEAKLAEEQAKAVSKKPTAKKTFDDICEEASSNKDLSQLVDGLKQYVNVVYGKQGSDGHTVANMNYNLFNLITGALQDPSKKVSNAKMNFINKVFLVEKDRYFNVIALTRYDHFWAFGAESKMGYSMLVKYISSMANPNTRKDVAKTHIAGNMSNYLPDGIVGKLEQFYKI